MRGRLAATLIALGWLVCARLGAIEASATFRLENLAFERDRDRTDTSFSGGDLLMGFSLGVRDNGTQDLTTEADYVYDDVLRNIVTGLVTYRGNLFSFGVGPFLGFFNTEQLWPKIGVASFFKVEWPGSVFVQLWLDNSSNNRLKDDGDYLQERDSLSFGFYVPEAICTINVLTKRFAERDGGVEISDTITRYSFVTDIYRKNVPFKIMLTFGLQQITRDWEDAAGDTTATLSSLILGTRFDLRVNDAVSLMISVDSSIYTFGSDELLGVSNPGTYLFRALAGVTVDVDRLIGAPVR